MNKNIKLAVAGAVLALSASANAGIIIPAGDWTLDIGGNVNTFITNTRASGSATITGGYAGFVSGPNSTTEKTESNITTGLLPNYLSVSGSTRQNDLDVAFTISVNPGASTTQGGRQSAQQENRQAFMTFGDKSWGSIKLGKDLGVFAGTAILNDMTLLGVGNGAGSLAGNTTTIGGIGSGYIYADWKAQAAYTSPNFSGFQFTLAATQGWNQISNASDGATTPTYYSLNTTGRSGSAPAAEGQLSYTFSGGAVSGKLWTSGIVQKINHNSTTVTLDDDRAQAADIGANVNFGDIGLTGYAYKADGLGTTIQFMDGYTVAGKQRKSDGGYVQATYTMPTKTKIGVAYGISNLDRNSTETSTNLVKENERTTVGVYHPLTKHLNTVLEYNEGKSQNQAGLENKARTVSLGAILFF
ncbi:OmpC Outer membrane protein (porin) [Candidatus Methylopumilus universalis]|uniref:porin n=1 Tax=Candidatus Methylopumilus universalis TaxID=2588536 RepID=UPI003BEEB0EC